MPSEEELKKQAQEKALDDDYESVQKLYKAENEKESQLFKNVAQNQEKKEEPEEKPEEKLEEEKKVEPEEPKVVTPTA